MSNPNPRLERALEEARSAIGSKDDVQRLRAKLGELPPAVAPAASVATRGARLGTKIATGAVAGILLIAGAMLLTPRAPSPAGSDRRAAEPPSRAPMQASEPTPQGPAPAAAPAPRPEPAPDVKAVRRKVAKAAPAPAIEAPAAAPLAARGPKELELLMSAQDAIEASPQRALGLLDEHARLYPSGNFAQERESLAIDVLRKLGRTTEAKERARAFIARFPKASNVKHLTRWLGESSASDHNEEARPLPTP